MREKAKFDRYGLSVSARVVLAGAAACLGVAGSVRHANANTIFATTGTYDPVNNPTGGTSADNFVDQIATGTSTGAPNQTATTGASDTLGGFKAKISSAFASNAGGVINFDTLQGGTASGATFDAVNSAVFGASGSKTLPITVTGGAGGTGSTGFRLNLNTGSAFSISGDAVANFNNSNTTTSDQTSGIINFGTITGGIAGEGVIQAGFTILSRTNFINSPQEWAVTATFSGGGQSVLAASLQNSATTAGISDTFYSFTAPANQTISSLAIDGTFGSNTRSTGIDDLAFITNAPEPASLGMLGLTGIGLLARRRRA